MTELSSVEPLKYAEFVKMWSKCFSHVVIRKYKSVESKCSTCMLLTQMRSKARSAAQREELTKLHAWHR